jgi:hypothetical protein
VYLRKWINKPFAIHYAGKLLPVGETTISWAELVLKKIAEFV